MVKCCHSKFKKNEAFVRYCEKTRAFAAHQVISSATFRVSPVMTTSISFPIRLASILQRPYIIAYSLTFCKRFCVLVSDKLGYLSSQPRYVLLRCPKKTSHLKALDFVRPLPLLIYNKTRHCRYCLSHYIF